MRLADAIEQADGTPEVKKLKSEGAFVCSAYVLLAPKEKITSWNVNYYSPRSKKITQVSVGKTVVVSEEDDPLVEKEYAPFSLKLKVGAEEALGIAEKEAARLKLDASKVLVSLTKDGVEHWSISFISKMGAIVNVRISVETGEIMFSEKTNLIDRKSSAG